MIKQRPFQPPFKHSDIGNVVQFMAKLLQAAETEK